MTKKELIELLADYPDDMTIVVEDDRDDGTDIDTLDIYRLEEVDHTAYRGCYADRVKVVRAIVLRPKH